MRRAPASLLVLVFGVVFSLAQHSPSRAAPSDQSQTDSPTRVYALAADSLVPRIASDDEAVGLPVSSSEVLLRNVQPGDRLDVVASLASRADGQPLTTVVARGVTVLKPPISGDPVVVEVPASDAVMLAHLVMNGTHLGYILWPAGVAPTEATAPVLDDQSLRDALGLSPVTATAIPTVAPTAIPTVPPHTASGFLYQVQPNDTWDSIAGTFGMPADQLRQWNEASNSGDPVPGSLVFIPRPS
jgi:LysM repeat protein